MRSPKEQANQPRSARKRRAGVFVAAIVVAMIVATFVGYNISHMKVMEEKRKSGKAEYTGLN